MPISSQFGPLYSKETDLGKLRTQYVGTAYPRLLYMMSDVICLVTTSSRRAIQETVDEIMLFGGHMAAGLVNQTKLPSLLLLYNKRTQKEGKWDVDSLLRQFQVPNQFYSYFREVRIVDIPQILSRKLYFNLI